MTSTLYVRFDVTGQPRSQVLSLIFFTRQMSCLCVVRCFLSGCGAILVQMRQAHDPF